MQFLGFYLFKELSNVEVSEFNCESQYSEALFLSSAIISISLQFRFETVSRKDKVPQQRHANAKSNEPRHVINQNISFAPWSIILQRKEKPQSCHKLFSYINETKPKNEICQQQKNPTDNI